MNKINIKQYKHPSLYEINSLHVVVVDRGLNVQFSASNSFFFFLIIINYSSKVAPLQFKSELELLS